MAPKRIDNQQCSFCGRNQNQAPPMVASPSGAHICSECVEVCRRMLNGEAAPAPGPQEEEPTVHPEEHEIPELAVPKPNELKAHLDDYVVGQEYIKKVLAVAVHNHYKRLQHKRLMKDSQAFDDRVEIEKSNIMMIGPTGCGKTLLARTLAQKLDVPFAITDATTLTEAGYVGEDVENILLRLVQSSDYDLGRAQVGIIYVDEIDKIARRTENVSITRDVSGEGVQQALLKIFEGSIANIPPKGGRKHPQQEYLRLDTSNILFICAGAFVGLDKTVHRRIGKRVLGFGSGDSQTEEFLSPDDKRLLSRVEPEDLIKYGLIPEFVGRLPVVATLEQLSEQELVQVLTAPRNSLLKQYQKLFEMEGVELTFTDGALEALAHQAIRKGTGARGLRAILETMMVNIMYDVPSRQDVESCRITKDVVEGKTLPKLTFREEEFKKSA